MNVQTVDPSREMYVLTYLGEDDDNGDEDDDSGDIKLTPCIMMIMVMEKNDGVESMMMMMAVM